MPPTDIPRTLDVVGKNYAVVEYPNDGPTSIVGESDSQTQEIRIATGTHPEAQRDTFLHEVVHAIDHQLGIGLTERQTVAMAAGLYYLLTRNPSMVSYVQGA